MGRKKIIIIVVVVVVIVGAAGIYYIAKGGFNKKQRYENCAETCEEIMFLESNIPACKKECESITGYSPTAETSKNTNTQITINAAKNINTVKNTNTTVNTNTASNTNTATSTSLIPSTSVLGNDLEKIDTYKANNEDYIRCPYNETVFYETGEILDDADYAIGVTKCRTEDEAEEQFEDKTSSSIFSTIFPSYGDESVESGSEDEISKTENIKFRLGIYYVDILGQGLDCEKTVVEDLAQKMENYLSGQSQTTTNINAVNTNATSVIDTSAEFYCEWSWPQKIIYKDTKEVVKRCTSSRPWCNSTDFAYENVGCCKDREHTDCITLPNL